MSANRDHERIEHILEYCIKVENAMKRFGRKYTDFVNDEEYRSCISFFLLQIGELANGLSDDFKSQTKDTVPWRQIIGFRNHVAHGYSRMEPKIIYNTMISDVPHLKSFCKTELERWPLGTGIERYCEAHQQQPSSSKKLDR